MYCTPKKLSGAQDQGETQNLKTKFLHENNASSFHLSSGEAKMETTGAIGEMTRMKMYCAELSHKAWGPGARMPRDMWVGQFINWK